MRNATIITAVSVFGAVVFGLAGPTLAAAATPSGDPASPTVSPSGDPEGSPSSWSGLWMPVLIHPSTVEAGGLVEIYTCEPDQTGTARSPAFGTVRLRQTNGITAYGRATVPPTTKAGTCQVDVLCSNGRPGRTPLKVTAANPVPGSQTTVKPSGAPETGGGGASAALAVTS